MKASTTPPSNPAPAPAAQGAGEPAWRTAIFGAQILFVAFGATVLVPLLTGLNPSLALLGAGVGTLIFQACTRR